MSNIVTTLVKGESNDKKTIKVYERKAYSADAKYYALAYAFDDSVIGSRNIREGWLEEFINSSMEFGWEVQHVRG